jgi:hypothetical protein
MKGAPMNELVNVSDKLKRTQEELGRHGTLARARTIKTGVLSLLFGMALGAFGMVYFEQPKVQPVGKTEVFLQWPTDQRVKELRFSLQKLERLKDVHDATLREAATNQGEIRQMVKALEVGK